MTLTWDQMISAFRDLGGVAENVMMRTGSRGRGLFPIDASKPVKLHVPANLLIPVRDVEFRDGQLVISDESDIGGAECDFFEAYQNTFSWGDGGRSDSAEYIQGYDALPSEISELLFGHGKPGTTATFDERVQQMFLQSRKIARNGVSGSDRENESVLMPVIDLTNHSPGAPSFQFSEGISISGVFPEEILVRYALEDSFGIFRAYGFASPERLAFSLASRRSEPPKLVIERRTNMNTSRGSFNIPDYRIEDDTLVLSCMMIGNMDFPRLSKGIFCDVARQAGWSDAEEEFDRIVHRNRLSFLSLLKKLEPYEGGIIPTIRKMVLYQLEAIFHCFGNREL
jgi:hypothetical protein